MFRTIILASWTLTHLYVFWRAAATPALTRLVPRRIMLAAGAVSWCGYFLFRGHGHDGTGLWAARLELWGMSWLTVLFLTATVLLAADLVTGFGLLLPRAAPRLRLLALVAGSALSGWAMFQGLRPPVVRDYEVQTSGLPRELDGTVLAVLSDLHLGSLLDGEWLAARVEQVNALHPDMVLLLGDLVEGHGPPAGELAPILRRVTARLGVWAVTGNHESHGPDDAGRRLLVEAGYRILDDRWEEVQPGLVVAGTAYDRSGGDGARIRRAVAGRVPGALVFLSHSPRDAPAVAAAGADLLLAGHTHGGQVWPFSCLVRLTTPLVAGRYDVRGMPAIVSRGAGTWGPRMRLWRPSEILRVTLRARP